MFRHGHVSRAHGTNACVVCLRDVSSVGLQTIDMPVSLQLFHAIACVGTRRERGAWRTCTCTRPHPHTIGSWRGLACQAFVARLAMRAGGHGAGCGGWLTAAHAWGHTVCATPVHSVHAAHVVAGCVAVRSEYIAGGCIGCLSTRACIQTRVGRECARSMIRREHTRLSLASDRLTSISHFFECRAYAYV
jgi:hypothetical protein